MCRAYLSTAASADSPKPSTPSCANAAVEDSGSPCPLEHGGTPSSSERGDYVVVVTPSCIEELRLVTVELPEKSSPIGPRYDPTSLFRFLRFSKVLPPVRKAYPSRPSRLSAEDSSPPRYALISRLRFRRLWVPGTGSEGDTGDSGGSRGASISGINHRYSD